MRIFFALIAVVLAGCSVVPPAAWTFNPAQPPARTELDPAEKAALTDRLAELQIQRNGIRDQISAERDVWARLELYSRLHQVGMELSPLERRLLTVAGAR